jgi:2-phosphoglycerate kinase
VVPAAATGWRGGSADGQNWPVTRRPGQLVTLVCGASGVGKSRAALALAARAGLPLAEADDIVTALRAITTGEQLPVLHYWAAHPEARSWAPPRIADLHLEVCDALRPAFAAVVADHVESGTPVVMEGDYLTPELARAYPDAVRAVVITEADVDQLVANYAVREPHDGEQRRRAEVSVLVGARLADRARRVGAAAVPARPWGDQLDRLDEALRAAARAGDARHRLR